MITFRAPAELAKQLRAAAARGKVKTSALTRQLVERALAKLAEDEERSKKRKR